MEEIDLLIIELFSLLTSDQKKAFINFAKALNLEVHNTGLQEHAE